MRWLSPCLLWPEERNWLQEGLQPYSAGSEGSTALVRTNDGLSYWWPWETPSERVAFHVPPKLAGPVLGFTSPSSSTSPKVLDFIGPGGAQASEFRSSLGDSNEQPGLRITAGSNCTLFSSPLSVRIRQRSFRAHVALGSWTCLETVSVEWGGRTRAEDATYKSGTKKTLKARPRLEVTGGGMGKRREREDGPRQRGKEGSFPDSLAGRAIPRKPVPCVRCTNTRYWLLEWAKLLEKG